MIFREKCVPVSVRREVRVTNKLGLHARPAAQFVKHVRRFRSEICLVTATGRYSGSSLIDVLRANLECGATATLEARGIDAEEAVEQLQALLENLHKFDQN
jgi:phosphotransferase system HPr (HPr) family protein